ncbi:MAG: acetyl-CoA carboxylase carboxyltransferase subunit alpha [Alphaproteobacteria bacterium]|jgi:acetyl-CoA carboxylase carboxyl transferase subunit alpha|nr:acetyl-CoA carboxylase carboxyltransferase subunit alpha [Alphaproteobacteria bacterium]
MRHFLDFEKPIAALEGKIEELRHLNSDSGMNIAEEIGKLQTRIDRELTTTYQKLGPWEKVQVARHPDRPKLAGILPLLFDEFTPLAGDRNYSEDHAVIGGVARFRGRPVVVMGTEKGTTTEERVKRNFGMARPEGYRKAIRLMQLAGQFGLPVLSFVDTAGAYPGRGAEERGQAEAIARAIQACLDLPVPLCAAITGEGGSGGAIALATGNRVVMYEHAVYSVISPEGCASILWRSAEHAKTAAEALRLTAQDMENLGVIDAIVPEPVGGAHRDPEAAIRALGDELARQLAQLDGLDAAALKADREAKYIAMGSRALS